MTINGRCLVQFLTLSISLVNLQLANFFSPKHPFGFKENQVKMECITKLSNFDIQWTKTL